MSIFGIAGKLWFLSSIGAVSLSSVDVAADDEEACGVDRA
jgi:hypothetical protein